MGGDRRSFRPEDGTARKIAQPTVVPPFDPGEFARESESQIALADPEERATLPPEAFYAELRESCGSSSLLAARPVAIDESPEVWESATRVMPEVPALDAVPRLVMSRDDLEWFELGADESALVHACDGNASIEAIANTCGVPADEAQRMFRRLSEQSVVDFV